MKKRFKLIYNFSIEVFVPFATQNFLMAFYFFPHSLHPISIHIVYLLCDDFKLPDITFTGSHRPNTTVQPDDALLCLQTDVHNYLNTVLPGKLTGLAAPVLWS